MKHLKTFESFGMDMSKEEFQMNHPAGSLGKK